MIKHNYNKRYILDGKTYEPKKDGYLYLPIEVKNLRPVIEEKEGIFNSEKDELIAMAIELGLGAESTLKRNSVETLKKKINEA